MLAAGLLAPAVAPYGYSTQSLPQRREPPADPPPPRPGERAPRPHRPGHPAARSDDSHRIGPLLPRPRGPAAPAELGEHGGRGAPVPRVRLVGLDVPGSRDLRHGPRLQPVRRRAARRARPGAPLALTTGPEASARPGSRRSTSRPKRRSPMSRRVLPAVCLALVCGLATPPSARAAGKDLVIGYLGDATSLNPVVATDGQSYIAEWPMFDSLVELDEKLGVRPLLAESWE